MQVGKTSGQTGEYVELSKLPRVVIEDRHLDAAQAEALLAKHIPVFGGNTVNQGEGGQAAVFRPLQRKYGVNAVPEIPTLVAPGQPFKDIGDKPDPRAAVVIEEAVKKIAQLSKEAGKPLLLLRDGYGTGIANLPSQPATWNLLNQLLSKYLGVVHKNINGNFQLCKSVDSKYKHMFEEELNGAVSKNPKPTLARQLLAKLFSTGKQIAA